MKKTSWIIAGVIVAVIAVSLITYNMSNKNGSATDAEIKAMMDAANKAGADTFENLTIEQVKAKLVKPSSEDVNRMAMLFATPAANNGDTPEGKEMMALFEKITGKSAKS
jgi:hypothetical protein